MPHPSAALALAALCLAPALAFADPALETQVAGLEIVALSDLPAAPKSGEVGEFCQHLLADPITTPAGAVVKAKGWKVTAETPFGALTAVSFISSAEQATSGTCDLLDGNLGFFDGIQLVALVYASDAKETLIGRVVPFGDKGLRLWSGDTLPQPLADVQPAGADGIAVTRLAPLEDVCNGTAKVPLIYGMPIDQARSLLAQHGWQPVPFAGERSTVYGIAPDLVAAGLPEVAECSGTGFGFCSFSYAEPAGTLFVTTAGEISEDGTLPSVADYGMDCG